MNEPGDEAYFDWTWKTLRSLSPGPFQPSLTSETDTSYFREDDIEGGCENQLQEQPDSSSGVGDDPNIGATRNGEAVNASFEGNQLSFAGFTFSSPKLAPLSGVYLAPSQTIHEVSSSVMEDTLSEKESSEQTQYIHELSKNIICILLTSFLMTKTFKYYISYRQYRWHSITSLPLTSQKINISSGLLFVDIFLSCFHLR